MINTTKRVLILSIFFMCSISYAEIDRKGNGGDEYAKEFIQFGLDIWRTLDRMPIDGVDNAALLRAIQITTVSSKVNLTLHGNEVDAINYPDKENPQIEVSRAGWDRMSASKHRRVFLVLHEYLGILGNDDSQFQISMQMDAARACPRNPAVRAELERRTKKFCYNITREDLHFLAHSFSLPFGSPFQATDISQWDFAGLDNIKHLVFNKFAPITVVRASTLNFLPDLESIRGISADQLEKLHAHSNIRSLDFSESPLTEIADGAFQNLSGLQELAIYLDAGQVDPAQALDGLAKLTKLSVRMKNAAIAPAFFIEYARANSNLRELVIRLDSGDATNILPELTDIGFRKVSWGEGFLMLVR